MQAKQWAADANLQLQTNGNKTTNLETRSQCTWQCQRRIWMTKMPHMKWHILKKPSMPPHQHLRCTNNCDGSKRIYLDFESLHYCWSVQSSNYSLRTVDIWNRSFQLFLQLQQTLPFECFDWREVEKVVWRSLQALFFTCITTFD